MTILEKVNALKEARALAMTFARSKIEGQLKGMNYEQADFGFFVKVKNNIAFQIHISYSDHVSDSKDVVASVYLDGTIAPAVVTAHSDNFGEMFAKYLFSNNLM